MRVAPSTEIQAGVLLSLTFLITIVQFSGRIRGRKDRECGAIGVSEIDGTLFWTIGPPAAKLYAVLPVGVEMIRPSPTQVVKKFSSMKISKETQYGEGPRSITTSFTT